MTEIGRTIGTMTFDGVVSDLHPPVQVNGGSLAKLTAEATYPRGTVLVRSAENNNLLILGTAVPEDDDPTDTYTLYGILCDDTTVGTDEDVFASVYTAGCFDSDKVTVAEDYTMTEDDKDQLRMRGIVFRNAAKL